MGLDAELLNDLLELFRAELTEKIQSITDGLLTLERGVRGTERQQVLDNIFRDAHSIKGAAHAIGVIDVGDIAHHLESLFGTLKNGSMKPPPELTDICLQSLDGMQEAMQAFDQQLALPFDIASLLRAMDEQTVQIDATGNRRAPQARKTRQRQVADGGDAVAKAVPAVEEVASGRQAAASPEAGLMQISIARLRDIAARAEELQAAKIEMSDHLRVVGQLRDRLHALMLEWRRHAPDKMRARGVASQADNDSGSRWAEALAALSATASSLYSKMRTGTGHLHIVADALDDQMRQIQLVPLSTILNPLRRTVRDIARDLEKSIVFDTTGDDVEMDRQMLDKLRDPLIHLLRNACDHGIESPDVRRKLGKPEAGTLTVEAARKGNQIVIAVRDDGAGIRVDDVVRVARRKKLLAGIEAETVDPALVLDLIFRSGFSSKEIITNVSGRGVGLDVVRANLATIKGIVEVSTVEGEGTIFTLTLPLTVANDRGLTVRAGGLVCAIPSNFVDRVLEIDREDIVDIESSQAIRFGERTIPLCALSDVLEVAGETCDYSGRLPVVVISAGQDGVAFLVDEILGEREILVKRFQPPLMSIRNVAGGTLTGSGAIIPVLNPSDLVRSAQRLKIRSHVVATGDDIEAPMRPRILVVDDSITTRTLEKSILENSGYSVEVAVDGKEAWNQLQSQTFDLVVTDIEMPGMDGFELTERIKKDEKLADLPVVIVTSLAKEADKRRGIEVGADAYIVKRQFETRVLLDVIGQII